MLALIDGRSLGSIDGTKRTKSSVLRLTGESFTAYVAYRHCAFRLKSKDAGESG